MKNKFNVSFIGAGNMAGAIIDAVLNSKTLSPSEISVSDLSPERLDYFSKRGIKTTTSNTELAEKDGILFLAVKPQVIDSVLSDIAGKIKSKCVVSIAAGVSSEHIRNIIGNGIDIIRVLPNTPMLALDGMTVIAKSDAPEDVFCFVTDVFKAAGEVSVLPENKINEAIPLSSSSPAFFFRALRAMASAGEKYGIPYEEALKLSAVAMKGSAEYLLQSGKTPDELIKQVSSPGGTTVAALSAFDDFNFESFANDVCKRCIDRAYELGNSKK